MSSVVRSQGKLGSLGPVFFGVAFLAPLIAQSLEALSLDVPFGIAPITVGLGVGLLLGAIAARRGRWI